MQTASFKTRIWVAESTLYDDNRYAASTSRIWSGGKSMTNLKSVHGKYEGESKSNAPFFIQE